MSFENMIIALKLVSLKQKYLVTKSSTFTHSEILSKWINLLGWKLSVEDVDNQGRDCGLMNRTFELSLTAFTEFGEFSDKKYYYFKKIAGLETTIFCMRDRDSTTAPQRHGLQRRQLN